MIPRYTRPEMGKIWDERNEWQTMLDVEIAACEANAKLGRIPEEAVKVIKEKANFDVDRIHEIDHEINHDIIAFLTNVGEYVGDEAKYIHMGLTSTDVKDTGLNVQIKQASPGPHCRSGKTRRSSEEKSCGIQVHTNHRQNTRCPC